MMFCEQKEYVDKMNKIVVATREEALALIASGTNSMLVFSPEAPNGYKKDGTVAGRRGRKPLAEEVVAARAAVAAEKALSPKGKLGPIVRTPEFPNGMKRDGTPMLKRGRPSKEAVALRTVAVAAPLSAVEPPSAAGETLVVDSSDNLEVPAAMAPIEIVEVSNSSDISEMSVETAPLEAVETSEVAEVSEQAFELVEGC